MYRLNLFRFLFCAFAAFSVALSASAQTQPGAIKAMRVTGEVMKLAANGTTSKVAEGQLLAESDTVITRASASVVLVFANGSSVRLAESSRMAIDEFKMDPLGSDIAVSRLTNEPSVSKTRLNLAYGEMVGNVKKLNAASSYDVKTPVGAAGIRGTTFRIVLRFDAQGKAAFSLATAEGLVQFTASGTVQLSSGTSAEVPAGTEVTAVATVDPVSGQVTGITVQTPSTISTTAAEAITTAVTNEIAAAATVTITTTDQTQNGGTPSEQPGQTGQPGQPGQSGQPGQPGQSGQPGQNPVDTGVISNS